VRFATRVVTVNDILDGHVSLDLECVDRIYLNGWVPNLPVSGQVVNFLTHHMGFPMPSLAILEKIGLRSAPGPAGRGSRHRSWRSSRIGRVR
jgi:hypothetical protein